MPTPADHFTAFVDALSSAPRVARAVAGESEARFRGRILLERAAYLMTSTDLTLQEIAADCGFARYDVFTRAFRREHGVLPSEWRADPTSFLIDSPTDVHFHPPSGLRLPARHRMDGVDLVVEMVEHHVRDVGALVDAAGRVADDDLDVPVGDATLRLTLSRLVDRMERFNALVHETAYDVAEQESLESLRRRLDRVGPDYVTTVALLGATGRFDEAFVDPFSPDPGVVTFGAMVTSVVTDADDLLRLASSHVMRIAGANPQSS